MYKKIRMAYNSTICIDTIKRHAEFSQIEIFILNLKQNKRYIQIYYILVITQIYHEFKVCSTACLFISSG